MKFTRKRGRAWTCQKQNKKNTTMSQQFCKYECRFKQDDLSNTTNFAQRWSFFSSQFCIHYGNGTYKLKAIIIYYSLFLTLSWYTEANLSTVCFHQQQCQNVISMKLKCIHVWMKIGTICLCLALAIAGLWKVPKWHLHSNLQCLDSVR